MKKLLTALIVLMTYGLSYAGNYVTSGKSYKWNNPSAWTCNCLPVMEGSTITINHKITRTATLSPQNSTIIINDTLIVNGSINFQFASHFILNPQGFLKVNYVNIYSPLAVIDLNSNMVVNNALQISNGSSLSIKKTATLATLNLNKKGIIKGTGKISWKLLQMASGGKIECASGFSYSQTRRPSGTSLNLASCGILPQHLVSIKALGNAKGSSIHWTTSEEKEKDYYSVERSNDGKEFYSVGTVAGLGNSNALQSYQFFDNSSVGEDSYYRIKQVDSDGNYEFSKIIYITGDSSQIIQIKGSVAYINSKGETKVQIISSRGEVLLDQTFNNGDGNQIQIDLSKGYSGINIIRVNTEGKLYTQRF